MTIEEINEGKRLISNVLKLPVPCYTIGSSVQPYVDYRQWPIEQEGNEGIWIRDIQPKMDEDLQCKFIGKITDCWDDDNFEWTFLNCTADIRFKVLVKILKENGK